MSEILKDAALALENGDFEKGNDLLDRLLSQDADNTEALLLKAKGYYKKQEWSNSLNHLNKVLEIDENHQVAKNYKKMVMDILSFWNKDSHNP